MKLFNTLTGAVVTLPKRPHGRFSLYFCGPTVYNHAHIGNFRTYLLQDVLVRTLEVEGYDPCVVRNITDVDDKTIRDSIKSGMALKDFTEKWTGIFHEDCRALNIRPPEFEPRATEHIAEQIAMVEALLAGGFAYVSADGSVYFRVSAFANYGKLSRLDSRELRTQAVDSGGGRNLADEYDREHAADFVLWKAAKPTDGNCHWPSPWGDGRPGWHIECSAMAKKYLGDTIDLHSGGIDLVFPHHENEIAQSECANGKVFCNHWMHIAHLLVDGTKMSKSLGNLYTLADVRARGFSAQCLRLALIAAHYRQPLNFTMNNLVAAKNALGQLRNFAKKIESPPPEKTNNQAAEINNRWQFFGDAAAALADDLNTPACLGNVFKAIHGIRPERLSGPRREALATEFATTMYCLGLRVDDGVEKSEIPEDVAQLAAARWSARLGKDFAEADRLRERLLALGWSMGDGKDTYTLEKT
jgi:cysteinyl-tRNA synthetase